MLAMENWRLVFRVHAIQRMFSRQISEENVRYVIKTGEEIESYPTDVPYPSKLILGWIGARPIHIVLATNVQQKELIIVTVYEPNRELWKDGFKERQP